MLTNLLLIVFDILVQVTGHAPKGLFITKMFPGKDQDKNPTFQKWKTWISLKSLNNLLCGMQTNYK